jgi:hypothetical protein
VIWSAKVERGEAINQEIERELVDENCAPPKELILSWRWHYQRLLFWLNVILLARLIRHFTEMAGEQKVPRVRCIAAVLVHHPVGFVDQTWHRNNEGGTDIEGEQIRRGNGNKDKIIGLKNFFHPPKGKRMKIL